MELTEGFNKEFAVDSDREYTIAEVEADLLRAETWNFNYKKFEVYRAFVSYQENEDIFKSRPVVVVKDKGETVLCLKCTSKRHDGNNEYIKYPIEYWQIAGFTKPSYIDLTSTIEINKHFFRKKMGKLKASDIEGLESMGV